MDRNLVHDRRTAAVPLGHGMEAEAGKAICKTTLHFAKDVSQTARETQEMQIIRLKPISTLLVSLA